MVVNEIKKSLKGANPTGNWAFDGQRWRSHHGGGATAAEVETSFPGHCFSTIEESKKSSQGSRSEEGQFKSLQLNEAQGRK